MFMTCDGLIESFSRVITCEVEVLSPAVFVEICGSVVVTWRGEGGKEGKRRGREGGG